jgi:adenylate cyclase
MALHEQRRLAAIMMLDVVGFSAMMAVDESATLARILEVRRDIIEPIIARYEGRVVKLMGDGALVEFGSVTAAVQSAVDIQQSLTQQGSENPVILRIGINLGDVIVEEDDIYGDGVNVAARIEALAKPGGIAISSTVFEQVRQRLKVVFEDGGAHMVKNIPNPVQVYHFRPDDDPASATVRKSNFVTSRRAWGSMLLVAVLVTAVATLGYWWQAGSPGKETTAAAPPALPDKPSIAVLPFDNLSGDAEQSYFSDGIANNLITDLSHISGLLVIARNTSFSFRDQNEDARSAAAELGIRYLVEGSVQKAGGHIRINANLVDASTGIQVWAGRLDREFVDLFALQDEVTAQIVEALQIELTQEERRLIAKRYTFSLEAYDLYLRAWEESFRFSEDARRISIELLNDALNIDPEFALAKSLMASSYTSRSGAISNLDLVHERAFTLAQEAVALDPDLTRVQSGMGLVHLFRREYDLAEASFNRAIALEPNFADGYALRAWAWQFEGKPEQALESLNYAIKLNPRPPFPYLAAMSEIYFNLGEYQKAIDQTESVLQRNPDSQRSRLIQAVCLALMGRIDDAEWDIEELLLLQPDFTIKDLPSILPYQDQTIIDRLIKGARLAGLPE